MSPTQALIITGPTASGKTRLAVELARLFNGEIISADCRQVYRRLDLGTGKDLDEYGVPPDAVPYHLIDIIDPDDDFNLLSFVQLATAALADITARGRLPIIAGGTPLYIHALLRGYDLPGGKPDSDFRKSLENLDDQALIERLRASASPELFQRTDLTQRKRIIRALEIARAPESAVTSPAPLDHPLILAPFYDRATIRARILQRLDQRLDAGMLEEVAALHTSGVSWERLDWYGLEYRYISRFLRGLCTRQEMHDELLNKIRNFAKSQDIWFRKLERENHPIHWIPQGNTEQAADLVRTWLAGLPLPAPDIVLNAIHYGPKTS